MEEVIKLEIDLDERQMEKLRFVARTRGLPLEEFVRVALNERAEAIIHHQDPIRLSARDMRRLMEILDEQDESGPRLKAAAERFRSKYRVE